MKVPTIRILIADDYPVVREGLRLLIDNEPDLEVVGIAADGTEAVNKARSLHPDIVIMDLVMTPMDGIQAIQALRHYVPNARVIVLSSFADEERVLAAIQAGARSYLLKESKPADLLQAIHDTHNGIHVLHPSVSHILIHALYHPVQTHPLANQLTERELDVLRLLAQGLNNHHIAQRLFISEDTTRTHVSNILHKLHLENRTAAALWAVRERLVPAVATSSVSAEANAQQEPLAIYP